MKTATFYSKYQEFLIRPADRIHFVASFVLLSWAIHWLIEWGLRAIYHLNWQPEPTNLVVEGITISLIDGSLRGTVQWFALRPYLPDWRWILATAVSATFAGTVDQVTNAGWHFNTMPENLIWILFTNVSLTLICVILLGLTQWFVLRSFVKNAQQWLIVVLLGIFVSMLFQGVVTLSWFLPDRGCLHIGIYTPAIFWSVQAIALCLFRRKTQVEKNILGLEPPLADAEAITQWQKLRQLSQTLKDKIDQTWKRELRTHLPLRYWLAVAENGSIVQYKPLNQPASNHVAETPLPRLSQLWQNDAKVSKFPSAIAQFEVKFTPLASFEIFSLSQPSLIWISLGMFMVLLAISSYPTLQCFWESAS